MIRKYTLISLGMLFFALISCWLIYYTYLAPKHTQTISDNQPDAFMENVIAIVMDKQGKPKLKITAPKMVHYNDQDKTHLVSPTFTLYRNSPTPWYIESRYANAYNGTEQVTFRDHVVIHHAADVKQPATVIKTDNLVVKPSAQTAETYDHITMEQPDLTVNAVGLFADMTTGNIKLLSNARGQYAPRN